MAEDKEEALNEEESSEEEEDLEDGEPEDLPEMSRT